MDLRLKKDMNINLTHREYIMYKPNTGDGAGGGGGEFVEKQKIQETGKKNLKSAL